MDVKGKSVVITGGSIGIGLQLARHLMAEGANVLVCARNLQALSKAKRNYPTLEIFQCDVTDQRQVKNLLNRAVELFGGVDILFNNAAVFQRFNILENYPLEKQLQEIDINFKGAVVVTNVFLNELLKSKEGAIVNLTSALGFMPMARAQIYSATKAAINSWTISLRHQLKNTNVSVVLLSPPVVDTRMNVDNPDVEGMKMISPEQMATQTVKSLRKNKKEILVGPIGSFKQLSRFMPGQAFKMINKSS